MGYAQICEGIKLMFLTFPITSGCCIFYIKWTFNVYILFSIPCLNQRKEKHRDFCLKVL